MDREEWSARTVLWEAPQQALDTCVFQTVLLRGAQLDSMKRLRDAQSRGGGGAYMIGLAGHERLS